MNAALAIIILIIYFTPPVTCFCFRAHAERQRRVFFSFFGFSSYWRRASVKEIAVGVRSDPNLPCYLIWKIAFLSAPQFSSVFSVRHASFKYQ